MKEIIGSNIARYRKEKNLTQEELAKKLSISTQAVSKWENAQTAPDITLLPIIASILEVSVDSIMGYSHNFDTRSYYEKSYQKDEYFWGVNPSKMCLKILELAPPIKSLSLLDIGCGEGKDAVFFARLGYKVSAFDISEAGLEKAKRLAENANVNIDIFKADMCDFRLEKKYDILYSSGTLHYIKPELRADVINNYKDFTVDNGINAFQTFVEKPFIEQIDKNNHHRFHWKSGELFTFYHDWLIEECSEYIFDCNSSGAQHKHASNKIFARKISRLVGVV